MKAAKKKIKPGEKVVVLGLGVSGWAAVKFLQKEGAVVAISEQRSLKQLPLEYSAFIEKNGILFEGEGHSERFCKSCDALFVSPGIPNDSVLLANIRALGIPILGELAIAAPYLTEKVVAVTGTNGKTTVTALIAGLLEAAGRKVFMGGNIGTPLFDYLCGERQAEVLVLELSSFQLDLAGSFAPHIGVLLNISPDHLDRHKTMERYVSAKSQLFTKQEMEDYAIFCADDPMCLNVAESFFVQRKCFFGTGGRGDVVTGDGRGFTVSLPGKESADYVLDKTSLDSHTGLLNAQAAVLVASILGCTKEGIQQGLRKFRLAPHRLQLVRKVSGVSYYNDSKATNTGAVQNGLSNFSGNVILIAGGQDKGEDYGSLRQVVREKVKELILIGETADSIATALAGTVHIQKANDLDEAVRLAAGISVSGDTVLLAPACASFDMFANYAERGESFVKAVMALPDAAGEQVH